MKRISGPRLSLTKFTEIKWVRFLLSGFLNTGLSYLVYIALLPLVAYKIAYTLSFVSGIVISYFLSALWVFKQPAALRSFLLFPLVYVAQYLFGLIGMYVLVEILRIPDWIAPLVLLPLSVPLSFLIARWVFRSQPTS